MKKLKYLILLIVLFNLWGCRRVNVPSHTHVAISKPYDEFEHYDVCSCGEIFNRESHSFQGEICSCGYDKYEANFCYDNNRIVGIKESVAEVHIPKSHNGNEIVEIKANCFSNLKSMITLYLPSSIKKINNDAFIGCDNLDSVFYYGNISDWCNIEFANMYANPMMCGASFYFFDNGRFSLIDEINIPTGIKKIKNSFCGFSNVSKVTISDSVEEIGDNSFYNCLSLANIEFGKSVIKIGENAFYNCRKLKELSFSENVSEIKGFAFYGCMSLQKITFNKNLKNIFSFAFAECNSIKNIYYNGSINDWLLISFEVEANPIKYASSFYYLENENYVKLVDLIISDDISKIGDYQFYGYQGLKTIVMENVLEIGNDAFYNCINLTVISSTSNLNVIGDRAFMKCISLKSFELSNNIISLGNRILYGTSSLEKLIVPSGFSIGVLFDGNVPLSLNEVIYK